jgi:hypothetical protein
MSVKSLKEGGANFTVRKETVNVKNGEAEFQFTASEVGFLAAQNIALRGLRGDNGLALLVAEAISDAEGNKFTYEEVLSLREDISKAFLDATLRVNGRDSAEKN